MINYADCFFAEKNGGLSKHINWFISEISFFKGEERGKWKKYEECKKILNCFNPSAIEYEVAIKRITERLEV